MLRLIAHKELRETVRDGRFKLAGGLVLLLLFASLAFGWRQANSVAAERASAQRVAEESWLGQGEKNPHVAAHYGKYVFKPAGVLAFLDPGADPFMGVTLKLEAHKQRLPHDASARDATALSRFGQLSAAAVLQLFVPLLLIALGFAAWSGERERGTLRQVASTGVSPQRLLAGKAVGLGTALALLMVPALLVAAGLAFFGLSAAEDEGVAPRLLALIGAYLVYFTAFAGVIFYASARAPSSRHALVALVGFWSVTTLVVPRVASDAAALVVPLPTADAFAATVKHSLDNGLPGGPARDDRVDAISTKLLAEAGFEGAESLMDEGMLQGFELQAEATYENEVFDHHVGALMADIERQERVAQWAALASPYLAIRSISEALAGTDFAHHRAFQADAEAYRRALVASLNDHLAQNGGADVWKYKAGRDVWAKAPVFAHETPDVGWALASQSVALAMLFAWLLLAWAAAWWSARRVQVVG